MFQFDTNCQKKLKVFPFSILVRKLRFHLAHRASYLVINVLWAWYILQWILGLVSFLSKRFLCIFFNMVGWKQGDYVQPHIYEMTIITFLSAMWVQEAPILRFLSVNCFDVSYRCGPGSHKHKGLYLKYKDKKTMCNSKSKWFISNLL